MVVLSTTQAEHISLVEGVKEAIWMKGMIGDLGIFQEYGKINYYSKNVIHFANPQVYHERTKHIITQIHLSCMRPTKGNKCFGFIGNK